MTTYQVTGVNVKRDKSETIFCPALNLTSLVGWPLGYESYVDLRRMGDILIYFHFRLVNLGRIIHFVRFHLWIVVGLPYWDTNINDPGDRATMMRYCSMSLRVRAFFHKTVRVCHVYCNFNIGFTCRITVTFGTLKDRNLLINTLASNICFSYGNMFQNGVDALSKIVDAVLSKSWKFHLVRIIR